MFHLGMFLFSAVLFFALTPGVLVSLPPKGKKYTVAAVHAVIFAVVWHCTHKAAWYLTEGFEATVPPRRTVKPSVPATTVRPSVPAATVRPSVPAATVRPSVPATTVRPSVPATTVRPSVPATTVRPSVPAQAKCTPEQMNEFDTNALKAGLTYKGNPNAYTTSINNQKTNSKCT
jgi:hypothetical protein